MVEVTVARLGLDSTSNSYVVILQEKGGVRFLPIWIGQPEAEAIATHLNDVKRERPMTHDLAKQLITGLGGTLRRVQITRVHEGTYFAELHLQHGDALLTVDARPSDSIAIALRLGAPMFAQDSLLTSPTDDDDTPVAPPDAPTADDSAQQLQDFLRNLRPEDFGKFSL
jgi:bifunctional DNase/RNase